MTEYTKPKSTDKKIEQINIAPHSLEAEQAILGSMMLDNSCWDDVAEKIQASDFYNYAHRIIFEQMLDLTRHNKPIDIITLERALKDKGVSEDVGGFAYLAEISKNTPSVANILTYADIVCEKAIYRELISASNKVAEMSYNPKGMQVKDVLDEAERAVFHIAEKRTSSDEGPKKVTDILDSTLSRIEILCQNKNGGVTGVSSGFTDLDKRTAGLQPSDLIIVAARPSMGKTTFAMNLCENASLLDIEEKDKQGNIIGKSPNKPVLIFSLEMPADQIMMRMLASLSKVDQTKIRTGQLTDDEDWAKLSSTTAILQERSNIFIDDSSALTPTELRSRARRIYRENGGLSLIMVDYLQLMRAPGYQDNRTLEIAEISRSLKALAKELEVPVVALSQLNRSLETRSDKRPVNSDLRESGSIEQDADLIMFIYRDEVYHEQSEQKGIAEIIIGKQRNGPIGKVRLAFNGQFSRFDNLAPNAYSYDDE
ncbi:MAG: replicative DNA helicase [Pasteurella sp.]|nr:replicative DNA helicase [Pasteurella sp.]